MYTHRHTYRGIYTMNSYFLCIFFCLIFQPQINPPLPAGFSQSAKWSLHVRKVLAASESQGRCWNHWKNEYDQWIRDQVYKKTLLRTPVISNNLIITSSLEEEVVPPIKNQASIYWSNLCSLLIQQSPHIQAHTLQLQVIILPPFPLPHLTHCTGQTLLAV